MTTATTTLNSKANTNHEQGLHFASHLHHALTLCARMRATDVSVVLTNNYLEHVHVTGVSM